MRLRLAHVPFWDSTKYGFRSEQFGVIERCPQSDSAFFSSSQCFGWYVCSETMPLQRDSIKPSVRQGLSGIRPGPGPLSSSQRLAMSIIDLMSVVAVRDLAAWVCLVRSRGLAHAQFNGIPCVCAGFACMDIWHLTPNGGAIGRARSAISANLSPPTKKKILPVY